jgi:hypothetical protein
MEAGDAATLLSIASPWPIAITLASYLPAGDLINLARTSVQLRAALHGFQPPSATDLQATPRSYPRLAPRIGSHETSYWKQLKEASPFLCASPTHTKGSRPHPCRYCSTPICEACIVRDSFAKGAENTFKNRCRFLCKSCWNSGNPHRRCRFKGDPASPEPGPSRYNFAPGDGEFCACTTKDDGWVCIRCKDVQNAEANSTGFGLCFGEGCTSVLEEDKDRRRICLWCDRPMLRGRASMESRLAFDQKMHDVRTMRGLSFEEATRKQQKLYKMSRRELRGDEAVAQDADADAPQFVRHLDTTNYQRFMRREHTPSGEQVYQSKLGRWVYDRTFLLEIGKCCKRLPKSVEVRNLTRVDGKQIERTNLEKSEELDKRRRMRRHGKVDSMTPRDAEFGSMLHLKGSDEAEALEFQHTRRSFFLPAETKAAERSGTGMLESESLQDMSDDYAFALALQAELDQEAAETLNAEFVADAAEEAHITQFESESVETESDEQYKRPLTSHSFVPPKNRDVQDRDCAPQGNENEVTLSRSEPQLKMREFGDTSNLEEIGHQGSFRLVSGRLMAPQQVSDSEGAGSKPSDPVLPQSRPKTNIDELENEAVILHSGGQSRARPFPDDRPPAPAG